MQRRGQTVLRRANGPRNWAGRWRSGGSDGSRIKRVRSHRRRDLNGHRLVDHRHRHFGYTLAVVVADLDGPPRNKLELARRCGASGSRRISCGLVPRARPFPDLGLRQRAAAIIARPVCFALRRFSVAWASARAVGSSLRSRTSAAGPTVMDMGSTVLRFFMVGPVLFLRDDVLAQARHGFELLQKPYEAEQLSRVLRVGHLTRGSRPFRI
jgi:hypothetical protein